MAKEKSNAAGSKTPAEKESSSKSGSLTLCLSMIRPFKKRASVFGAFLVLCALICALYDTCDVKKKKQDCGYSGISPLECRTTACFTKGGGEMDKLKITINRTKGSKLGLKFEEQAKKKSTYIVDSISDGAVREHNAISDMPLELQDIIVHVDGSSDVGKALKRTESTKVVLDIRRSKLPRVLRSIIHRGGKPGIVEKVLTAPNFISWLRTSSQMSGLGFVLWFISGYHPASLPFYYFGLSGAVGWHLNKCCHDANVQGGVPHCYKGGKSDIAGAMGKVWNYTSGQITKVSAKPKSYLKYFFEPPKFSF